MDLHPNRYLSHHTKSNCHPYFWLSNPTGKTLSTLSTVVLQADNCYNWLLQLFILSKSCISLEQPPPQNCGLLHLGAVKPSSLQDWPSLTILLNITYILTYFMSYIGYNPPTPSLFSALLIFLQLDAHMSRSPTGVWHYWKIDRSVNRVLRQDRWHWFHR